MIERNYNPIKHGIKEGKRFIASWCQAASNITSEVLADSGMDILIIDCEHAPSSFETLIRQQQAMNGYKAAWHAQKAVYNRDLSFIDYMVMNHPIMTICIAILILLAVIAIFI